MSKYLVNETDKTIFNGVIPRYETGFITLSSSTGGTVSSGNVIPLNKVFCSKGNKLIADTSKYRITVGKGISKVRICFSVEGWRGSRIQVALRKNGEGINPVIGYAGSDQYATINMAPKWFDVKEGDYFDLVVYDATLTVSNGIGNPNLCYLTVEY